jgi:hypothetical protein
LPFAAFSNTDRSRDGSSASLLVHRALRAIRFCHLVVAPAAKDVTLRPAADQAMRSLVATHIADIRLCLYPQTVSVP